MRASFINFFFLALVLGLAPAGMSQPSSVPREDFWVPDGPAFSVAESNGVVYIGGSFDNVGPKITQGVWLDSISGARDSNFPEIDGPVLGVAPDGNGGWFIGGEFSLVGGAAHTNLAHILSDKSLDSAWSPQVDGVIYALALSSNTLYVAGTFTNLSQRPRKNLAAVDATTGMPTDFNPVLNEEFEDFITSAVFALALQGRTLYVGGFFSYAGGERRDGLAAFDVQSGLVLPWNPAPYAASSLPFVNEASISTLAVAGNKVYVGGYFQQMSNQLRNNIASLDPATGAAAPWNPNANGEVFALQVFCNTVYVGGYFTRVGGQFRNNIAALDPVSGLASGWNPNAVGGNPSAGGAVISLAVAGNTVYAGGWFTSIGGSPRRGTAAVDLTTGLALPWTPEIQGRPEVLAIFANRVFAGGLLIGGGQPRQNFAAFDSVTGKLLDLNPAPNDRVTVLAVGTNVLYLGGMFTSVAGQSRSRLAAINLATGALTGWNPGANYFPNTIVAGSNVVYVGGDPTLTVIGGQVRNGLAALNVTNGQAITSWNPKPDDAVRSLSLSGNTLYVAGLFFNIGQTRRVNFAALDATTGIVLPTWNPNSQGPSGVGEAIQASGGEVYLGGSFTSIGGQAHHNIGAVDAANAAPASWNADITLGPESNPGAYVWSLVVNSNTVFAGGFFDAVNGESRPGLAALAADTGALLPWNPGVKGSAGTGTLIDYMAASDKAVFVVGEFKSIGGVYHPGFAMFAPEGAPRIVRQPVSQTVPVGETAQFSVEATGLAPLFYQWRFNGANLDGETATNLTIVNLQPEQAGHYDVVVSNSLGQVSSAIARLIASQPIGILSLSPSQTAPGGATVTLSVTATGSPPPLFQWRLNGVNIPGAVFSALTLPNLRPQDGGSYTVVVDNGSGAVISDVIELEVDSPTLPLVDNFADRVTTSSFAGVGMGTNTLATKENGEPNHANQTGGRSVWFSWQAPADGVAVFRTRGSGFDTVLAVYTNLTVDGTNLVAADDDQGGFLTSMVSFNAVSGMEYQIAIDGFAGASGNIVLTWNLQPGTNLIPIIFSQPQSQSVPLRSNYTFDALAAGQAPLRYQWYHNCLLIAGATNASLLLTNIQATDVGLYFVQVSNKAGTVQSESAFLELGPAPQTVSQDKLEDLLQADARSGALLTANKGRGPLSASSVSAFISVSAGAIGAQILDNTGATTQQGETNHCGVLGGASKWFGLQPVDEGVLLIDTIGSSIDTVLAVYTGTNLLNLREIACDNNSAPDGIRSLVRFTVVKGAKYCVVVDGVNGAQGNTSLNWRLGRAPASVPLVTTPSTVRLGGHLALSVTVTNAIPTPAYQWLWNGRIIPGGTASNLNLSNLQASQAGIYSVVASNFAGAITSTVAIVTIALPIQLSYEITQNNGRIQFRLMGPASTGLVMEASSDLMNWMPLFTNAAASLPLDFTEAPATNSPFRFYRVMPWP